MTLRLGTGISPLLRRPFAFSAYDPDARAGELIYERRGLATKLLSALQPEDNLDLIGPLGNTFPLPAPGSLPVLVAGGIGIGPMLFLYQELRSKDISPVLLIGARSIDRIPEGLLPNGTRICTDDGSGGFAGTVLQYLEQNMDRQAPVLNLYACGPHGMMKAIAHWSMANESQCWVSLEQTMACAVGACMGCVVKINHEKQYSRVCSEGPVYPGDRIDWSH